MGKLKRAFLVPLLVSFLLILPSAIVEAKIIAPTAPTNIGGNSLAKQMIVGIKTNLCQKFAGNPTFKNFSILLPSYCSVTPQPEPEPDPEPVDVCPNIPGDQEEVPDRYHLDGGECIEDMPEPDPEPALDHLIISEVLYNAVGGSEASNEWVEIYNNTGADVNLSGWTIGDAVGDDILTDTIIEDGQFVVIAAVNVPAGIPAEAQVIIVGNSMGDNGLANGGDIVVLKNAEGAVVDRVSWGTNTTAFDPSVPAGVADGATIYRVSLEVDTDTAADWNESVNPTPGLPTVNLE